ncbi:hypothetical protein HU200_029031 [Digitaria exilis]|uniref:Uncharacterized protein n=1 Tax=Digitaria exilis TaxID=1010633 RepID=A0A835EPL8_9POAL|nr:hypothetical protein HU200_029031 [Digitaria exilis]
MVNHQEQFQPAITVSVIVNQILGTYMVPIVHHDDVPTVFLIRLPSPADVAMFNNHSWLWITEEVFFRRVSRLVHHGGRDIGPNTALVQIY